MICRNSDVPETIFPGILLVKESTQLTAIIRQVNDLLCDMRKENNFNFLKIKISQESSYTMMKFISLIVVLIFQLEIL